MAVDQTAFSVSMKTNLSQDFSTQEKKKKTAKPIHMSAISVGQRQEN